jgi:hypothetical protein
MGIAHVPPFFDFDAVETMVSQISQKPWIFDIPTHIRDLFPSESATFSSQSMAMTCFAVYRFFVDSKMDSCLRDEPESFDLRK